MKFFIKTFGCQMNEHDSERIAGLLEADGMTRTDDAADADVVHIATTTAQETKHIATIRFIFSSPVFIWR